MCQAQTKLGSAWVNYKLMISSYLNLLGLSRLPSSQHYKLYKNTLTNLFLLSSYMQLLRSSSIEVVFNVGCLPSFKNFLIILSSSKVESKFCSFPAASIYYSHLPLMLSFMKVVFHNFKIFKLVLSSTKVAESLLNWF